jgi:hypothetical protein
MDAPGQRAQARQKVVLADMRLTGRLGTCYNAHTAGPRALVQRSRCCRRPQWRPVSPTRHCGLSIFVSPIVWLCFGSGTVGRVFRLRLDHRDCRRHRLWLSRSPSEDRGAPQRTPYIGDSYSINCSFARLSSRAVGVLHGTQKRPYSLRPESSRVIPPYFTATWQRDRVPQSRGRSNIVTPSRWAKEDVVNEVIRLSFPRSNNMGERLIRNVRCCAIR